MIKTLTYRIDEFKELSSSFLKTLKAFNKTSASFSEFLETFVSGDYSSMSDSSDLIKAIAMLKDFVEKQNTFLQEFTYFKSDVDDCQRAAGDALRRFIDGI